MFGPFRSLSMASTSKFILGSALTCHPAVSSSMRSSSTVAVAALRAKPRLVSGSRTTSRVQSLFAPSSTSSQRACTCVGPSPLGRRLHSRSTPSPHTTTTTRPSTSMYSLLTIRSFFTSSRLSGPRSYYYNRGSGGGGTGGRGSSSYSSFKHKIDRLPSNYILFGIIGLNVSVFLAWQYGKSLLVQFRDPAWLKFLTDNFTVSWRNIQNGRLWTILTCCFSHEGTSHILMNLLSLFFMAPPVMAVLGNSGFLALYLFAGAISSCVSLVASKLSHSSPFYQSHGASGAVYGTLACFATMFPTTTFLLFFVVPVPAWLCVGGIFAWDLYGSLRRRGGTTDSAGHVGGIMAGVVWALRRAGRF
ncbi:hypothetical protein OIV83_001049 [Microbotryomycetes sp. JL201]|nr:hypothetical protein OIV83_001049 [Microbotryomycetes sp. JL201]